MRTMFGFIVHRLGALRVAPILPYELKIKEALRASLILRFIG